MRMHWDFARADKPTRNADGSLAVRGRLGKGAADAYQLAVSGASLGGLDLGVAAYVGRSRDGRPMILTDRGPFTVDTRGVHVGRGSAVVILDTRAKKVKREYFGGVEGGVYVIAGASKVSVLTKRGVCLTPPTAAPGALKSAASCEGSRTPVEGVGFSERVAGAITAAPEADLALVRKLLPQTAELDDETLRLKIGRIDGRHLVVTPW
jgi:hypothetical protein